MSFQMMTKCTNKRGLAFQTFGAAEEKLLLPKTVRTRGKAKPSVIIPQRLNSTCHLSCQYYCTDATVARWRRIWRRECKPLKTNATGECLAYHTWSTKRTNMYSNRSAYLPDVRSLYCQPSNVASYRGSAMSAVTTRCPKSYFKEQWMVVVADKDYKILERQHY